MKTVLQKVYYYEHCNKHMISASSMSRHEKYCSSNPNNIHKCFEYCIHLKRKRIYGRLEHGETVFTCDVTGNEMYSYLLEKKKSILPYHIKLDDKIRMPLGCNLFKSMTNEQIDKNHTRTLDKGWQYEDKNY